MRHLLAILSIAFCAVPAVAQLDWRRAELMPDFAYASAHDMVRHRTVYWLGDSSVAEWDGRFWDRSTSGTAPLNYVSRMAWDPSNGSVLLLTGQSANSGPPLETWTWNGQSWSQRTGAMPPRRTGFALAPDLARSRVVLFGGYFPGNNYNETWEWDGSNWTRRLPATSPPARVSAAMAWHASSGAVVLTGGTSSGVVTPVYYTDTWEWNGTNWLQRTASGPAAAYSALGQAPGGNLVLFGGQMPSVTLGQTWLWDGVAWSQASPPVQPPATSNALITYDSVRDVATLFKGGEDLWEWDGSDWTIRSEATPGVDLAAMDTARGRVVTLGYIGSPVSSPVTAEWDGASWSKRSTGPPHRVGAALAQQGGGRVLLFGGSLVPTVNLIDETWSWDGAAWTQHAPTIRPSARYRHAMAYDPVRGEVVLFGGQSATSIVGDTWTWDGATWSQQLPQTSPPARRYHGMAFDPSRGMTVLFTGQSATGMVGDTWEWDGANWSQASPTASPPAMQGPLLVTAPDGQGVLHHSTSPSPQLWRWDGVAWTLVPTTNSLASYNANSPGAADPVHGHVLLLLHGNAWLLDTPTYAEFRRFGLGCLGTAGRPELGVARDWPFLGNTVVLETRNVPTSALVFLAMGFSADQQGTTPLPQMLNAFGMPRCMQYCSIEATALTVENGGAATLNFAIPNAPGLIGVELFAQSAVVDVGANAAGVTTSNGARLRIGSP